MEDELRVVACGTSDNQCQDNERGSEGSGKQVVVVAVVVVTDTFLTYFRC